MLAQIIKQTSDNIAQSLAKHAPNLASPKTALPKNPPASAEGISKNPPSRAEGARGWVDLPSQDFQNLAQTPLKKGEQATFLTRFGNELAQNQTPAKNTQSVFDFDFIARDKSPNFTPELPQSQSAQTPAKNPPASAADSLNNPPANAQANTGGDLARHQELESSLDSRFNNFEKQASDSGQDINKWFEAQRSAGKKEVLDYDKDLAEYRKLDDFIRIEKQEKENKAYYKKSTQEWLEKYKPAMIDKTDEEIIATQGKEAGKSYDEAKYLLASMRKDIERNLDLQPLSEFGTNYAEFYQDGKGAIAKLIAEANAAKQAGQDFSGQVAGAFSKEIDGAPARIDLVWGNEKMGLEKILQKHLDDFSDFSGGNPHEKLANGLSKIITQGEVIEKDGVKTIWLKENDKNFVAGLSKGWKGNGENLWVITSYEKTKGYIPNLRGDSLNLSAYKAEFNPLLTSSDEPLNNEIIQKISQKFNKDEQYAKNLYEWHKDSHPLTKEADGTPKVFYHGSKADFEVFKRQNKAELGHFFTDIKSYANTYKNKNGKLYKAFLHIKKPMDLRDKKLAQKYSKAIFGKDLAQLEERLKQNLNGLKPTLHELKGEWMRLRMDKHKKLDTNYIFAKKAEELGFDGIIDFNGALVVFDSNQIKSIGNKGTFDATNPNIYHSSSTAGGGLAGGSIAGVERDDEGNIIGFSPEKFALGFAAGAGGAKALGKIANTQTAQNISAKTLQMLAKQARTNPRAKAVLEKMQVKSDIISQSKIHKGEAMPIQQTKNRNKIYDLKINTQEYDKTSFEMRKNLHNALKPFVSKPLTNENDGRVAYISAKNIGKFGSKTAVDTSVKNGFSEAQHFEVAKHLPELYKSAKLRDVQPDLKHGDPNINIPRYEIAFTLDGEIAMAKITLKETLSGAYKGNKIYTIELESIVKLSNGL